MNDQSLLKGILNPSTLFDLTAGLGYGLIYQPVIGSALSPDYPFAKKILFPHRRKSYRRFEKRR